MQAASDLFLGWTRSDTGRHFYVRQLRDVKVKLLVEAYDANIDDDLRGIVRLGVGAPTPA
jgi:hypothetical protein